MLELAENVKEVSHGSIFHLYFSLSLNPSFSNKMWFCISADQPRGRIEDGWEHTWWPSSEEAQHHKGKGDPWLGAENHPPWGPPSYGRRLQGAACYPQEGTPKGHQLSSFLLFLKRFPFWALSLVNYYGRCYYKNGFTALLLLVWVATCAILFNKKRCFFFFFFFLLCVR